MANKYLEEKSRREQHIFELGEQIGIQKMLDYIYIAMNQLDGYGHDRCCRIYKKLVELTDYFHPAFTDNVEADYKQEQLDGLLRQICGEDFVPFYERYPELKKIDYSKSKKGWK